MDDAAQAHFQHPQKIDAHNMHDMVVSSKYNRQARLTTRGPGKKKANLSHGFQTIEVVFKVFRVARHRFFLISFVQRLVDGFPMIKLFR